MARVATAPPDHSKNVRRSMVSPESDDRSVELLFDITQAGRVLQTLRPATNVASEFAE
jgi:hypothetical protein